MKSLFLFFVAFLSCACLSAQSFKIAYSEPFEEPKGQVNLLYLHNGNTAFVTISEDGIRVRIYSKEHALVADQNTDHDKWTDRKFSAAEFQGAYEIGDNIILFFSQLYRGNMLALHRLAFSPVTGQMIKTDEIGRIPTLRSYGYTLDHMVMSTFYIRQDPVTGNYAVLTFEGYTENKADRVKLQVYDTDNKLIKETSLDNANSGRYIHFAGMCMSNNNIFLCVNDYDPKSKSLAVPLYLSELKDGSNSFITRKIDNLHCNKETDNRLVYNADRNILQMVTTTIPESHEKMGFNKTTITMYFRSTITTITPSDLTVVSTLPYVTPKADEYARQKLGEPKGFNGICPELVTNYDNSTTLVAFEGHRIIGKAGSEYVSKMGISYLNDLGTESSAYVIRVPEAVGASMYHENGMFSHELLSTSNGDYVIYNDLPENFDKPEKEEPHVLNTISDACTVICKLENGKIEKQYLFGAPENKRSGNFSRTEDAIYDKGSDTYITVMTRNNNGKKNSYIAWVDMSKASTK